MLDQNANFFFAVYLKLNYYTAHKIIQFWKKKSLIDCLWSNLNAPGSETPAPQYEDEEVEKLKEQNQLNNCLQMVQFEGTGYRNPCVSSIFG